MTLCDAGPLYALINKKDPHCARCRETLPRLSLPLLTTLPCFTEAMHLAYSAGGWRMQNSLWQLCERGDLIFHFSNEQELLRMRELMESYSDTPMDLADASIVVAAETLNQSIVFTTDSDFYVYRRQGNLPFQVLI